MPSIPYPAGLRGIANNTIDLIGGTIKVMLVNAAYAFNNAHANVSDVVGNEVSGTGYTGGYNGAGRLTCANKTVAGTTTATWTFDNPTWTAVNGFTIGGAVVFQQGASDAASPLITFIDPADLVTNGGNITLTLSSAALTITPV